MLLTKRSQGLDNKTQCVREWHRKGPSCRWVTAKGGIFIFFSSLFVVDHRRSLRGVVYSPHCIIFTYHLSHFTRLILLSTFCVPHFYIFQSHHFPRPFLLTSFSFLISLTSFYTPHFFHFCRLKFLGLDLSLNHRRPRPIRPEEQKL